MGSWKSDVIELGGRRLHYTRTGGGGPPVVLAHGFSEDGLVWAALAEELEGTYDVIMPDARGHGRSDPAEAGLAGADLAADLRGVIVALGLARPAVLGHSMGGMTTLALAGLYPDVPGAIVVEDGMPFEMRPRPAAADGARDGLRAYFDMIKGKSHAELVAWRRDQSPNWSETDVRTFADAKGRLDPRTLAPFTGGPQPAEDRAAPPPLDWPALLRQIRCPALLITGDPELGAIVTAEQAADLQAQVPGLRIAHIAGASHDVRRDQHAAFLAVITPFLAAWAAARR